MHPESSTASRDSITPGAAIPRNGVLVLTGYGIRVAVERGHLLVRDGRGRERRQGRFSRADRSLRRLVVLGHTGTVSFDALRWLHDVGCAFLQIDRDGEIVAAWGPPGSDNARLRRAQALATGNGVGLGIARDLIWDKLSAQSGVLDAMERAGAGPAAATVRQCRDALANADTLEAVRWLEADAASIYFAAWSGIPVRWARHDAAKVPDHWRSFGSRRSPLSSSPRRAVDPANALLNYAYGMLEAEASISLLAVGLDPGMGVLHADLPGRDSLSFDVMEPVRADVDRWILGELERRTFEARDFFETREGVCRLMPKLAKAIAETTPRWATLLAPVVERVTKALITASKDKSSQGAGGEAGSPRDAGAQRDTPRTNAGYPGGCLECGVVLEPSARRRYCNECMPRQRAVLGTGEGRVALEMTRSAFAAAGGRAALAKMRAAGRDPAHGGDAAERRGRTITAQMAAGTAWDQEHGDIDDGTDFIRDVLPGLRSIPLQVMVNATGLSRGYCSFIRRGLKVPHRRHWTVLTRLIEEQP